MTNEHVCKYTRVPGSPGARPYYYCLECWENVGKDEQARPCFDREGPLKRDSWCDRTGHCWHVGNEQHTVENHRDDICCYCNQSRCVRFLEPRPFRENMDGTQYGVHGRFRHGEMVK